MRTAALGVELAIADSSGERLVMSVRQLPPDGLDQQMLQTSSRRAGRQSLRVGGPLAARPGLLGHHAHQHHCDDQDDDHEDRRRKIDHRWLTSSHLGRDGHRQRARTIAVPPKVEDGEAALVPKPVVVTVAARSPDRRIRHADGRSPPAVLELLTSSPARRVEVITLRIASVRRPYFAQSCGAVRSLHVGCSSLRQGRADQPRRSPESKPGTASFHSRQLGPATLRRPRRGLIVGGLRCMSPGQLYANRRGGSLTTTAARGR